MGITVYSVAISIVFYNLALIAVFILRHSLGFRARHTVSLLAFITVLGVVRLVLPIDFDAAYVVRSYRIIPAVEDFLRRPLAASFTYGHLLLALWAVGSLVMVIKDIRLQRRFDRYLQSIDFVDRPELLELAAEYGSNFAVLISPQLNMPFTSGILHPVIYLPDVELSGAEWRMVFCHEITHIRSRDNLKKLFFLAVEALFWWNPLAHFSSVEINALIELRCDAKVTAEMNEKEKLDYITVLKTVMESASQNGHPALMASMIGTQAEMQSRFEALLSGNNDSQSKRFKGAFFCVILLLLLSYFIIAQPAHAVPKDYSTFLGDGHYVETRDAMQNSDTYIVYNDGTYSLYISGNYVATVQEGEVFSNPDFCIIPIIYGGTDNEENCMRYPSDHNVS